MSRYNRCKECYNMKCVFVTGEREDIDTSECSDFRPMTNADRILAMSVEELANQLVSEQYVAMKMVLTLLCQKLKDEEILDEKDAKELFCNFENEAKKRWGDMLKEKFDWLKTPAEVDK